jgi:hypothetical protein
MVCAFGQQETACVTAGHRLAVMRVSDSRTIFLMPDNAPAAGNQDLAAAPRQTVAACGLAVADAGTLRTRRAGI